MRWIKMDWQGKENGRGCHAPATSQMRKTREILRA
jgi:hypothetical protein